MKKKNEFQKALIEVMAVAAKKGIAIKAITLADFWYEPLEAKSPARLLGVDVEFYKDQLDGDRVIIN